jgi:hypothetical protein
MGKKEDEELELELSADRESAIQYHNDIIIILIKKYDVH